MDKWKFVLISFMNFKFSNSAKIKSGTGDIMLGKKDFELMNMLLFDFLKIPDIAYIMN